MLRFWLQLVSLDPKERTEEEQKKEEKTVVKEVYAGGKLHIFLILELFLFSLFSAWGP